MKNLDMQGLQLISINDILKEHFFIPSYQRGYRWEKSQVISLLDDIFEFTKKDNKTHGEFYCLQPIVITKKKDVWCVIDGQQRLTTIYIILKFLEEAKNILFPMSGLFSLSYETRLESENFLNKIRETIKANDENADFYCMSVAYLTIKEWFEKKEQEQKINIGDFLNTLIKVDYQNTGNADVVDNANNVRFIWYYVETENEDSDKQLFKKINMGRIPLTNAELIKALFLTSNIEPEEKEKWQNNFSYEWNEIEDALQDDEFWLFLNHENYDKITRIDFIFDLLTRINKNNNNISKKDDYYTFNIFNNSIKDKTKSIKDLWDEVKRIFRTLKEWFSDKDKEYYHLVGYLIHTGKPIAYIFKLSIDSKKSDFKRKLKKEIKNIMEIKEEELDSLNYNEDKEKVKNVLLLFNILSSMKSDNSYFSFQKYVKEKWSLEHIHAQNSKSLNTDEQRRKLLEEQKDYYSELNRGEITSIIEELLKQKEIEKDRFDELQTKIDDDGNNNLIHNLALLSSKNNSTLSNDTFKEKRHKIISLDTKGEFIPLCTKNVFLKYYSAETTQNEKWTQKDGDEYIKVIKETLNDVIFNEEKNGKKN